MAARRSPFALQEEYVSNYEAEPTLERFHLSNAFIRGVRGPWGCTAGDHEVLTRTGWVRMDAWAGQDILVCAEDTKRSWFESADYVVESCKSFLHFASRGLDMLVSDEHRILHFKKFNRDMPRVATAAAIAKAHAELKEGWDGLIPCAFAAPENALGVDLTDADLRVMVMVCADGSFSANTETTRCTVCVRKERKKQRLMQLLVAAGIDWTEYRNPTRPTEIAFRFNSPERNKSLAKYWQASAAQLAIIAEEVRYWDGQVDSGYSDWAFFSTDEAEAEFVAYAFSTQGRRASVSFQEPENSAWKRCYVVAGTTRPMAGLRYGANKPEIARVASEDGKKYCFTTTSGFFVTRRNGKICVTGNSGKSVGCVEEMLMRAHQQAPDRYKRRRTCWAAVRNTYGMLKTTTMRTWVEWVPEHIAPINRGEPMNAHLVVDLPDGTTVDMEVWFISCDKPADVTKLRGLELTGAWLNEASELDKSILDTVSARVGRFPPKKDAPLTWTGVIMDTNSMDDDHWWYKLAEGVEDREEQEEYEELIRKLREILVSIGMDRPLFEFFDQPPALLEQSGSYIPNPEAENVRHQQLGYAYWLMLCAGKSKDWIDTFILNKYGKVIDGKPVYSTSEYDDTVHGKKLELKPYAGMAITIGIDFGLSPAIIPGQISPTGRLTVFGELCAKERSMGMRRFINDAVKPYLAQRFGTVDKNGQPWRYKFIGDPAGNDRADSDESTGYQMVREAGFEIEPAPTNNFSARRDAVAWFLTKRDGFAMDGSCIMLRKGFRAGYHYRRIQVSGEARFADQPYDNKYTHPHDALQYAALPFCAIEVPAAGYKALPQWMQKVRAQGQASRPYMKRGGRMAA